MARGKMDMYAQKVAVTFMVLALGTSFACPLRGGVLAQVAPESGSTPALPATKHAAAPEPQSAASAPEIDPWILHSKDDRFTLRIGAQLQVRYTASDADIKAQRNAFNVQEIRPQIRATIGKPWITVFIQAELANTPQALDLELTVQPVPEFGIKAGQFLTPFSRTFYTPVPKLLLQDYSIANTFFRADRQTGAMAFGTPLADKLEYYAGGFNGNRIDQSGNDDDQMLFVGRIAANPLGAVAYDETPALAGAQPFRLALGANAYYGRVPPTPVTVPAYPLPTDTTPTLVANAAPGRDKTATFGADVAMHVGLATFQAEFYYRDLAPAGASPHVQGNGGYAHASCFVYYPYFEVVGRVNYFDPDRRVKGDHTLAYDGAVNVYGFGNNLKLNLRYTRFDDPAAPPGKQPAQNQFLAQTQWYF